ncbi:Response regulator receiver modulated diguanylate cyclase/phosphodiesterase [Hyella patelloides LEGE 07179]|uniref:Response regulator receiver modulated diguanylate cyclase/phosphodiesterase n=1 Tax=Hyella patelloides LEGE 07179 TaxID=945734 RepID=A0A563W4H6_9CYAN|nr:GGDEF domain-containing response regulator [Hyella patelloides]VEP18575.1 Response regulator receiver modulated diguanylate cyclase/phosphodiesterase [Hyella patelloides LEGE 07179]
MNNILVVDDIVDNLRFLSQTLSAQGYKVRGAKNGTTALKVVKKIIPDLILLDIKMPDLDGYEICQQLKADSTTKDIPIIFLSALDDVLDKVKAFEVGAVDYVTKPFQLEEVLARVKNQLALQSAKAEITQLNQQLEQKIQERTAQLQTANQKLQIANQELQQEVQERQKIEQRLVQDALHDDLTGLPNRTLLMDRIERSLQLTKRNPHHLFALLFIDLDRFKIINDSQGHLVGDKLLIAIADILSEGLRDTDTLARLGGDEFVILLENINHLTDATKVADRINQQLQLSFNLEGQMAFTSASIGIALSSTGYENSSQILRDADIAMYRAKDKGKACYEVFDQAMYLETLKNIELEHNLRLALPQNELTLHYQPIISLKHGTLTGFEALIRWQHPQQGLIFPGDFISIAEDTGLIVPIGYWVLKEACQQLHSWQQKFAQIPGIDSFKISVNLASQQIQEANFIEKLDLILAETGLDAGCLRLEITERVLVDSGQNTQQNLAEIKRRQIKLSIDDFGTGYSSLSYLHCLPINNLKIDRSFINNLNIDTESFEIVKTIVTLAHSLNMDAIAEGVETIEQVNHLKALGCEYAQGYLYAKPLEVKDIELNFLNNYAKTSDFLGACF